jgi:hypothetical protein
MLLNELKFGVGERASAEPEIMMAARKGAVPGA